MKFKPITICALAALVATPAISQNYPVPQQKAPPSPFERPPTPASEVLPDHSVLFRLFAPKATEAQLYIDGEGYGMYDMTKGADGVWSVNVGKLPPEMYNFQFVMGGTTMPLDTVVVPGDTLRDYQVQDVPRGTVTAHPYYSKVQNRWRSMNVYLPPQYYKNRNQRFPVLYLFAGMGEDEWIQLGHANVVFDNLIAQGKMKPFIAVMPNNTVGPVPVPALKNAEIMGHELNEVILPLVDASYPTIPDRLHRAIAGVSFGGGTAFTLGARNLNEFAYIGEFSTGAFGGGDVTKFAPGYAAFNPDNIAPNLYANFAAPATKPKLLFMTVGDADPRAPFQRKAAETFAQHGTTPVFHSYPGRHEWKAFRASLSALAPLLFR